MGNAPSSVPYGSSINLLNTTLQCFETSSGQSTPMAVQLPLIMSVTAPLYVGSGQSFFYSDINVQVTLPSPLDPGEPDSGYRAYITLVLEATGTDNSTLMLNATEINGNYDPVVTIPSSLEDFPVLSPQGPFTVSSQSPSIVDLVLRSINIDANLITPVGNNEVNRDYSFSCGDQGGFEYILASTAIDKYQSDVTAPANGRVANFPPTLNGTKTTIAQVVNNCSLQLPPYIESLNPEPYFNLTVGGTGPAVIPAGSDFDLKNFNTFLTVPSKAISVLNGPAAAPSSSPESRRVSFDVGKTTNGKEFTADTADFFPGIGLNLTGASPDSLDLARDFTDSHDWLPLSTARYVKYNNPDPVVYPLPLVSSLSRTLTSTTGSFGVEIASFEGALADAAPLEHAPGYLDVKCSVLNNPQILRAPIV